MGGPLAAQPTGEYTFYTYPAGAKVYLHIAVPDQVANPGTSAAEASFVGLSGQPLPLDLKPYINNQTNQLNASFSLRMAGHEDVLQRPDNDLLTYGRWPKTGRVNLPPLSSSVAVRDFITEHPVGTALGVLGTLLTGLGLVRQRWTIKQARAREEKREALLGSGDGSDPNIGRKLGHYVVVDRLGAGGMAVVYRAVPEGTLDARQSVAVKVISPLVGDDQEFRDRFIREVRTYIELNHPNIVRLIEWGNTEPMYLAMELIEGGTLRERLAAGALPVDEAVGLMYPMIGALAYAHEKGIIHRDLKPENIMLASRNLVKVMDFGLARSREVSRQLTATGTALGTPDYMSPEQINGEAGPSSDQYALGIIFFEVLCGRLPFEGDIMTVLFKHMSEEAPPVRQFRPEVPAELEALVARMVARDEASRFESLDAVLVELERLFPRLAAWRQTSSDPFPAGTFDNLG